MFEERLCKGCGFAIEDHYWVSPPDFCGRCYRTLTKLATVWRHLIEEPRMLKQIAFSAIYAKQYAHGAPGHLDMLTVAKLAGLLDNPGGVFND